MKEEELYDRMNRFSDRQIVVTILDMLSEKQHIELLETLERDY